MTFQQFTPLFEKYRNKGLLLDTNLLLLLLIGSGVPHLLETFKPIQNQGFKKKDFELLARACSFFKTLITTPHILTETSNHSGKVSEPHRRAGFSGTCAPHRKARRKVLSIKDSGGPTSLRPSRTGRYCGFGDLAGRVPRYDSGFRTRRIFTQHGN